MKVAVTGKGGAGKTTVAAILARALARSGHEVVAVDADPNPNLGIALGLTPEATARLEGIVNALIGERKEHQRMHETGQGHGHPPRDGGGEQGPVAGPSLRGLLDGKVVSDLVGEMGVPAPDGVTLVQTGRVERPSEGCLCCGSHGTTRKIFTEIEGERRVVVADLEAGVNDLIWASPKPEDTVVIVTEPYVKSLEVARRAALVVRQLEVGKVLVIANRVEAPDDAEDVRQALPGLEVVEVPEDPEIMRADREGLAPIDVAPESPAVSAVRALAARLTS